MAGKREETLAHNEAVFRTGNERMAAWEERHRAEDVEAYFCECADLDCRVKVPLSEAEYEKVRSDSCQFVVAPGHEILDVETVVEVHDTWMVVEKDPEVRDIVEATDPRGP